MKSDYFQQFRASVCFPGIDTGLFSKFLKPVIGAIFTVVFLWTPSYRAAAQIVVPEGRFKIETHSQPVIICNEFPANPAGTFTTITLGTGIYNFQSPASNLNRGTEYKVVKDGITYNLWFSGVAIVDLTVPGTINADDEIPGNIVVMDTVGATYSSAMAIKHRGATSLTYPKKSYRVQLKDGAGKNKDESIFGLRSDKRWLMLALYNERLRINNKVCHDLWLDMHKLYYIDREPNALSTIRSRYTLVFVNNVYQGVYLFTEDVDKKQYKLKSGANDEDVEGELYKGEDNGPPNFFGSSFPIPALPPPYSSETWAKMELKHPSTSTWENLRNFSLYIKDTPTLDLQRDLWTQLHKGNFIDYYLYINMVYAEDNLGKNLFMGRYKRGEPYFYGVWDLDGTLGFKYNSDRNPRGRDLIENGIANRVLNNNTTLKDEIALRWFRLRQNLLSDQNILDRIQRHYDHLKSNGVYTLESKVQSRSPASTTDGGWDRTYLNYSSGELAYMKQFMTTRLARMDLLIEPWLQSPLPVRLSGFKAGIEERQVLLEWSVTEEVNFDRFEIEHSRDGRQWAKIGEVKGKGGSEKPVDYSFFYDLPLSGINYYRLKMIDLDLSSVLSEIRSVTVKSDDGLMVYPNPASGRLSVETGGLADVQEIALYDLSGRVRAAGVPVKGERRLHLDVSELQGLYLLKIRFENGPEVVRRVLVGQ